MPMISFGGPKHDVWLSAIIASILGLLNTYLIISLARRYPSHSIIQYGELLVGKILGKIIGFLYVGYFMVVAIYASRDFAELFLNYIMPYTPTAVFTGIILFTAGYALSKELQVLGRVSEIMVPIIFLIIIIGVLENITNMNYIPSLALEQSLSSILSDSIHQLPIFGWVAIWLILFPALKNKAGAMKTLNLSILIVSFILFFVSITIVAVLGPKMPLYINYQFFFIFEQIELVDKIQRLESLFLIAWVMTSFTVVSIFYYAAVSSLQQCFGLDSYRPLIIPMGLILFIFSIYSFPSYMELRDFLRFEVFGIISLPMFLGIPLLLLLISKYKNSSLEKI